MFGFRAVVAFPQHIGLIKVTVGDRFGIKHQAVWPLTKTV
jgi:hypothetical protein